MLGQPDGQRKAVTGSFFGQGYYNLIMGRSVFGTGLATAGTFVVRRLLSGLDGRVLITGSCNLAGFFIVFTTITYNVFINPF